MLKSLYTIIDDVKRKPYDLLDYTRNQFDRDYLEFNVNIHDLEISLQVGEAMADLCAAEVSHFCLVLLDLQLWVLYGA